MDLALNLFKPRNKLLQTIRLLCVLLALLIWLPGCLAGNREAVNAESGEEPGQRTAAASNEQYSVYFTDPGDPTSRDYRGGPDQHLADAIRRARVSVDMAVLQLDLWSVRDALLAAHRRGLRVRMVTESDYLDEREVEQLVEAGVPVIGDRRQGLMHNKFVVIDQLEVWTGSMNFTVSEGYRNNNTLVRIRSPQLAQNYLNEFEEMFLDDRFGPGSPANIAHPIIDSGGTLIETCFSPEDGCTSRLTDAIHTAHENIVFLAYSFTSDELAEALIERASNGVAVRGVMESSQVASNRGTDLERFLASGIEVRLDGNPDQMHHKFMVLDGKVVAVGSFNFTYSAEAYNDENLLIIEDSAFAGFFLAEFDRVFDQAVK